jgi:hypothetical protein
MVNAQARAFLWRKQRETGVYRPETPQPVEIPERRMPLFL